LTFYGLALDSNGDTSAEGTSAPSVIVNVNPAGLPSAPVNLTATPVSTTSIALAFAELNSNQIGFKIERATEPSFTIFTTLFTINRPFISTYTDVGLSPGTRYFYRVIAFSHAGDSAPSLTADATTLFTPSKLGFAQQPVSQAAGAIAPIVVHVQTPSGGVSTIDNSNVTLTIASGPTGATLGGTTTVQAVAGVATFSDLTLTKAGAYTLLATDADLGTGKSVKFTVSPQTASAHLVLVQQPTTPPLVGVKGVPAYVVDLDDQFGNLVTAAKSKVSVSVASGPSFSPSGTTTVALKKGVGTFNNLILPATGNYVLHLTDSTFGTTAVVSQAVAIATTTIATPKETTATAGKDVMLTAHLTSNAPKKVPFGGFVSIGIQGTLGFTILAVGTIAANGTVKFNLADIPVGRYANVQVAYTGDVSHTAAMSGPFTLLMNPGANFHASPL
jgi:Fibronectin type III domain